MVATTAARVVDLTREYYLGAETVRALRGVTLDFPAGDYAAIMGPSGSGKSTLLNLLGCLDRPTSGHYFLGGEDVAGLDDDELSYIRASRIGFIFQSFNLVSQLSVVENIEVPLFYRGNVTARDRERCVELAQRVGLGDRLHHRPNELSGGQRQRCAIARSMVNEPQILLADEPTGALDTETSGEIMRLLAELNDEGRTIIVVTHENEVAALARRIVRFRDGEVQSDERFQPPVAQSARETIRSE